MNPLEESCAQSSDTLDMCDIEAGTLVFLRHDQAECGPRVGVVIASTVSALGFTAFEVLWSDVSITHHVGETLRRVDF